MYLEDTHIYVVNSILQGSHAHNYKNKGRLGTKLVHINVVDMTIIFIHFCNDSKMYGV